MTTDTKNDMATANVVDSILLLIRHRLYSHKQSSCFHQDRKQLIYAITWPAHWLQRRGLATSPKAYYSLIAQRIEEIARHGHSEKYSQHLPSYILKCIQQHLFHHGDQLYEKLKHIRNFIESIPIKNSTRRHPKRPTTSLRPGHATTPQNCRSGQIRQKRPHSNETLVAKTIPQKNKRATSIRKSPFSSMPHTHHNAMTKTVPKDDQSVAIAPNYCICQFGKTYDVNSERNSYRGGAARRSRERQHLFDDRARASLLA